MKISILLLFIFVQGQGLKASVPKIKQVNSLERKVTVDISYLFLSHLIRKLGEQCHIPVGIEFNNDLEKSDPNAKPTDFHQKQAFKYEDIKISALFDEIILLYPQYKWIETDGVVCFLLKNDSESFMKVPIKQILLEKLSSSNTAEAICKIPEIAQLMSLNKIFCFNASLVAGDLSNKPKLSLDARNITFLQVLNKLASQSGFWMVTLNKDFFSASFG